LSIDREDGVCAVEAGHHTQRRNERDPARGKGSAYAGSNRRHVEQRRHGKNPESERAEPIAARARQKEPIFVEELGAGVTSNRLASLLLGYLDPSGACRRDELGETQGSERSRSACCDASDL